MDFAFDRDLAVQFGINEAIFLQMLFFWTLKNKSENKNCYSVSMNVNGKTKNIIATWICSSVKELSDFFPFWSQHQIRTILLKCFSKGLIYISSASKGAYNRKNSYALTDKAKAFFKEQEVGQNGKMHLPVWANGSKKGILFLKLIKLRVF